MAVGRRDKEDLLIGYSTPVGKQLVFNHCIISEDGCHDEFNKGDAIELIYQPGNQLPAKNAHHDSFGDLWFFPTLLAGIGGVANHLWRGRAPA